MAKIINLKIPQSKEVTLKLNNNNITLKIDNERLVYKLENKSVITI